MSTQTGRRPADRGTAMSTQTETALKESETAGKRPNVVFVLSDDMSWSDMGCFGQTRIATPNLDRLAEAGRRFTACYAGAPVCAPSRSCLMQGQHMGHAAVRDNSVSPCEGIQYRHSLCETDVTVAHMFKKEGYATGMFGKWGLALSGQPGLPRQMGFDQFFGYLNQRKAHNYYPPYLWRNEQKVLLPENDGHDHRRPNSYDESGRCLVNGVKDPLRASYSFDLCQKEAMKFVRDNCGTPFFLYLPVTIPHAALEVPDLGEYRDRDWPLEHKIYAAMNTRLDAAVGELVQLLKDEGQYEKTLILFAGDNGYSHSGTGSQERSLDDFFRHSGPFRGRKGDLNQGGVRVPALAHWPGRVPAGTVCPTPWAFFDLMPTFCELLGIDPPEEVDGVSVLPTFVDQPGFQEEREFMYWEFRDEQAARIDDFWVHRSHPSSGIEVYHADSDPAQESDLAAEKPEIVARAEEIFAGEHRSTPYFPDPGESREAWRQRLAAAGVELPDNING